MARKNAKPDLISRLRVWAVAGGAENLVLTNEWEILRLRVRTGVAIVYRTKKGSQTWNDNATRLCDAMLANKPFPDDLRIAPRIANTGKPSVAHRTLIDRDGEGCFFCGNETPGAMTIEHLVPRAHGGPNHISNKFRACEPCNRRAGHLSAPEKIRIREAMHSGLSTEVTS